MAINMMNSEERRETCRVWHNCKYHRVALNAETLPILKRLKVIDGDYLNPTDTEWLTLARFREVPA